MFNSKIALELMALKRDLSLKTEAMDKLKEENAALSLVAEEYRQKKEAIAEALISAHVIAGEIERDAKDGADICADAETLSEHDIEELVELGKWI